MQKADDSVPPRDFHPLGIKGILMCSSVDKVLPLTEILVDLLVLWPSGFQCYVCKFFLKLQPQSAAHTPSTTQIAKSSLWWSAFWLDMHSGSQWQYFGQLQERRNGLDWVTVKTFRSLKVGWMSAPCWVGCLYVDLRDAWMLVMSGAHAHSLAMLGSWHRAISYHPISTNTLSRFRCENTILRQVWMACSRIFCSEKAEVQRCDAASALFSFFVSQNYEPSEFHEVLHMLGESMGQLFQSGKGLEELRLPLEKSILEKFFLFIGYRSAWIIVTQSYSLLR